MGVRSIRHTKSKKGTTFAIHVTEMLQFTFEDIHAAFKLNVLPQVLQICNIFIKVVNDLKQKLVELENLLQNTRELSDEPDEELSNEVFCQARSHYILGLKFFC